MKEHAYLLSARSVSTVGRILISKHSQLVWGVVRHCSQSMLRMRRVPLRSRPPVTDLCVSSCYKWLLATHGTAPCYLSEKAESVTRTTTFGWRNLDAHGNGSAERKLSVAEYPMPEKLEAGNPAMATIMFLERSLDLLLEVGVERIESHVTRFI